MLKQSILGWSPTYLSSCLRSATTGQTLPTFQKEIPNLTKMPTEYHNLRQVSTTSLPLCLRYQFSPWCLPFQRLTDPPLIFRSATQSINTLSQHKAFEELKCLLTSAPIFIFPDPSLQFVLEVDASETGVRAILS